MIYYMILLIIISNNIPLSLSIIFIYHFVSDGLLIQYINLSSYCSFDSYSSISCLLRLNFSLFRSFYKVLQLTKAYKIEPALDNACIEKI